MLSPISVESISCPPSNRLEEQLQEFLTRKRPHARTEAPHRTMAPYRGDRCRVHAGCECGEEAAAQSPPCLVGTSAADGQPGGDSGEPIACVPIGRRPGVTTLAGTVPFPLPQFRQL